MTPSVTSGYTVLVTSRYIRDLACGSLGRDTTPGAACAGARQSSVRWHTGSIARTSGRPVCANVPTHLAFPSMLSFACQPTAKKRSPNEQHRLPGWCNRHHRRRAVVFRPALTPREADEPVLRRGLRRGGMSWRWSTDAKEPLAWPLFGHDIRIRHQSVAGLHPPAIRALRHRGWRSSRSEQRSAKFDLAVTSASAPAGSLVGAVPTGCVQRIRCHPMDTLN